MVCDNSTLTLLFSLIEKARLLGADTVMSVKYKSGVGFTTWNYMKATGTAVKMMK